MTAWEEAQRAVIGSLLIDPEHVAGLIFATARRELFGHAGYRHVFDAAAGIWADRRPVDPVTIAAASGDEYVGLLRDAMELTPTAANVDIYLGILRKEARLRTASAITWTG